VKSLSIQFRNRRVEMGISQREAARRAGGEQPLVSGFERGRDIRISTLQKLASALDLELVAVPREYMGEVASVISRKPVSPVPAPEKSLLDRFQVSDGEEV